MNWFALAALGAASLLAPAAVAQTPVPPAAPPASVRDWQAAARGDILAAYDLYVANHPGMHDPANPAFPARLRRAHDEALAIAGKAKDQAGYAMALGRFSDELSDGHALLVPKAPASASEPLRWPSFVPAWRGDRLLVFHAEAGAPVQAGERILACDGVPAADFLRRRLSGQNFRPNEGGQWWAHAPRALVQWQPVPQPPRSCRVERTDGAARDVTLNWVAAPLELFAHIASASEGERPEIGFSEPRPGIFHVGMPTFQPNEEGRAAYARLYQVLRERRSELLKARAVIVDLRHNGGGSSAWSRDAADILWGEPQVDRAMAELFRGVEIWWRASPGNSTHVAELAEKVRAAGREGLALMLGATATDMRAAAAKGELFYKEPTDGGALAGQAPPPSDFTAPVYVITGGRCASACLDAVDVFTRFANTRLIGAPTSADSIYMEVRSQDLPSGAGRIVIPNKMWANRRRGTGDIYKPHIRFDDLGWTTAAFIDRIEADLRKR